MKEILCRECRQAIQYTPCANFIVFCPHCLQYTFLECEYGYGSVVPCYIYMGEKEIGIITQKEDYRYYLQTLYFDEIIKLEQSYLEALKEAIALVESKISVDINSNILGK